MDKAMLRAELRAVRGLRDQFENCVIGDGAEKWRMEAKKFLRQETCWVKRSPKARILTLSPEPFNPASFIDKGWSIWRGPASGEGLEGEEARDARSLALSEIDMSLVRFENMLNEEDGEGSIEGEEKLLRLKAVKFMRLDARVGRDLLIEPGYATLEWLHQEKGISWFDLLGTVLRDPHGRRCVLSLNLCGPGWWDWRVYWLGSDRYRGGPSAVL